MPTYEYKCSACGHEFEKFQQITAPPIKRCPSCGKSRVRRLIGRGSALIFRGSGFYTTDYRDAAYKDRAKADQPAPAKSEATAKSTDKATDKTPAPPPAKAEAPKPESSKDASPKNESGKGDAPAKRSSRKK